MNFIHHSQLPPNTKVSYASFVYDHRSLKSQQWKVQLVVDGDKLTCPYDTGAVQPGSLPPLSADNKIKVQQIIGCLLYYARA